MDETYKAALWNQFGATIDSLQDAIEACPNELWEHRLWRDGTKEVDYSAVWNVMSHVLFWLDLYLSGSEDGFEPPPPFGLEELDASGPLPARRFTKDEIQGYLAHCRAKCHETIEAMTDDTAAAVCDLGRFRPSFYELQLYNMRHVQEHAAQLSLLLGREIGLGTRWVARAR